ncbi:hypothetical protein C453_15683 [Haloferax elongans ATCC BAA-1513]|uniref:DUF8106 domain-containing protein n=1 Tax=Haloferax elongans ATCC BAA-1513 TaxID=1230453 RepID=M0HDI4_HALEO|nr:hypothetical protein [Haloferax elongans]ELZ82540.1 hypothetical protein C453_15683 [Haloferax elongans ATCC BAA-1513]
MSDTPGEFSTDPPDFDHRKAILFCQTCGRAAALGDWPTHEVDGQLQRIDCPDCGATVWRGFTADDDSAGRTVSAPIP